MKLKKYKTFWTCDLCGKEFKSKEESDKHELKCFKNPKNREFPYTVSPKKSWIYLWITTILVFATTCFISVKSNSQGFNLYQKNIFTYLFLGNIGLGVIAFLEIAFSNRKPKNKTVPILVKYILLICFVYFLINSVIFISESEELKLNNEKNKNYQNLNLLPTQALSPTPTIKTKTQNTNSNTVSKSQNDKTDCVGPDGKHFQTTQKECDDFNKAWGYIPPTPTTDPNKIVNCTISTNCGGGFKEMYKKQCDDMICCQTNNGWILTSKSNCNNTQNSENYSWWVNFCAGLWPVNSYGFRDQGYFDCLNSYKK